MPVKEFCGLFGIYGAPDAAEKTFYGLYALQHRGQESAGIASTDGKSITCHRGMGLVAEVFDQAVIEKLRNPIAIGHVRYSTTGSSTLQNAQPLVVNYIGGPLGIAHNGNLVNSSSLRRKLEQSGCIFQTTTDSEVIVQLLAQPDYQGPDGFSRCMRTIRGAYSLLLLTPKEIIAVRDPGGFRPLCLGKLGASWVVASETCAFDLVGAEYLREIEPGELLRLTSSGPVSEFFVRREETHPSFCAFEYVYFARPDSILFGQAVQEVRKRLGRQLAREHPAAADVVIPIPDSGNAAALGFAEESGIPFDHGFIRNHYVGRTFIQPSQTMRDVGVGIKLNPVPSVIRGKRLVVVDDSIIRGTTSRSRIQKLREVGAAEVHMRVSCPPHISPCYYGIDFPDKKELIASQKSIPEIQRYLGLDTLGYLSLEGMLEAIGNSANRTCTACWTAKYPVPVTETVEKLAHERKC